MEYKYIFESIYGLESKYISFFAIEYEYNYAVRDMDISPPMQFSTLLPISYDK